MLCLFSPSTIDTNKRCKGNTMGRQRAGITLIETLVVIGILGLLLAILIPAV